MYFNLSDCAKQLKWEKICLCSSWVGALGVGEKLNPLSSSSISCGVSSYVLRLWIVKSLVRRWDKEEFEGSGVRDADGMVVDGGFGWCFFAGGVLMWGVCCLFLFLRFDRGWFCGQSVEG